MIWIKAQNGESLLQVNQLLMKGKKIEGIIHWHPMQKWSEIVGKYESAERAQEVLDDIFCTMEESKGHFVTYTMPAQ
ncbi:hypothetical protein ACFFJI_04255 [Allobacillus sp. GCM10007491]|uniref:Uncharacterized protein n=2 Tax=Allobacillus TaxID=1400133 RepID=A0A941HTJ0_9BACI|nr:MULTISPECIES: hypothetical protein [Allobacillus]MBR7553987.1 hypothetical protein [Allobacillus saliphilus]TSJ60055.1 hypothetical protein FPQ13_12340 [Allobacillus salarius]